jgi:cytochrome c oxidase subunit 2
MFSSRQDNRAMTSWARAFGRTGRVAPFLVFALALAACGGTSAEYPQSTLHPKADFARMIDGVFMTTVWWSLAVFILVEGALLYVIFRYRGKPDDAEPNQVHGNTTLEIIWTAIPALILAMIAVPTVRAIFETYEVPKGGDVLEIEVIGHQWWWEFRYPQYGVTTANEMHVPAGRTVSLRMKAYDVLHSFWVPQFAAKRDVFPNRTTTLWFRADSTGYYSGQCAEFCGIQHGRMAFHVAATTPEEFDGYVTRLQATAGPAAAPARTDSAATTAATPTRTTTLAATQEPAVRRSPRDSALPAARPAPRDSVPPPQATTPAPGSVEEGQKLFAGRGCVACHSINATKPMGIGPNLANIGSRRYIGAGMLENTDENLALWIKDPQAIKHGVLMANLGLTIEQARSVAGYLRTLK